MKTLIYIFIIYTSSVTAKSYQVGEKWSKIHISKASTRVQILKESVGEVGASATLFYIGKHKEKHLALTNYHVCPNQTHSSHFIKNRCIDQRVSFFYFRNHRGKPLRGKIINVLKTVKNLDLSVLELKLDNLSDFERAPTPLRITQQLPYTGQELISVGFGAYNNEYGVMMIEEDSFECQVFSRKIKLTPDPDILNPIDYKVYSFLHGCDVSHGDSGSPILDRNSLEVVGLLWSGKYPKDDKISQAGFEQLSLDFLWKQLNYAAPSSFIYKEISELLE